MRLHGDGRLSLSPSDLSGHLACPHLTTLSLAAARGEIVKPKLDSPHRDLIFSKGNDHEAAYLARLEGEGRSFVRIPTYDDPDFEAGEAQRRGSVGQGRSSKPITCTPGAARRSSRISAVTSGRPSVAATSR